MDNIYNNKKTEYNSVPIEYCLHCLSINILNFNEDVGYCRECGNTELESSQILDWEDLFEARYGYKFINR